MAAEAATGSIIAPTVKAIAGDVATTASAAEMLAGKPLWTCGGAIGLKMEALRPVATRPRDGGTPPRTYNYDHVQNQRRKAAPLPLMHRP